MNAGLVVYADTMTTELRARWKAGEKTIGGWCAIPSSISAELMSRAGFDWLCLDAQHGLMDEAETITMLQAIAIVGTPTLVRVAWNEPGRIGRALDAGAHGVIVPMVNTPEEAERAVAACRYPPEGHRSWGPIRHALAIDGFTPELGNQHAACAIMIETRQAVEGIDAILKTPGVDAVYLGPMDLSVSYGEGPGALLNTTKGLEVLRSIAEACERHDVMPGTHCPDLDAARTLGDLGFKMLNVSGDARFLRAGAEAVVATLSTGRVTGAAGGYA